MTKFSVLSTMDVEVTEELDYAPIHNSNDQSPDIYNHINLSNQAFVFLSNLNSSIESQRDYENRTFLFNRNEWSHFYDLVFSWQGILLITIFATFIIVTIIGNTLIILSVITTRRLRTVTNCFVMSLAVADLLVGIFVMPPAVAVHFLGSWQLGWVLCDIWISLDVLLCTASILSLCAISVDRYLAVTQPLRYSRKRRSKRLALVMIFVVWILALAITSPPMLGWYEQGRRDLNECRYNQNEGYVIFSAMGSFFIPMAVMVYVYARISCVISSRHDNMTNITRPSKKLTKNPSDDVEGEIDPDIAGQAANPKRQIAAAIQLSAEGTKQDVCNQMDIEDENDLPLKHSSFELATGRRTTSVKLQTQQIVYSGCTSSMSSIKQMQQMQQMQQQQQPLNKRTQQQKHLSHRVTSLKKENKTTQTLSIVVGGFIACWLPFFIYYLITPFLTAQQASTTLAKILTWLGWFNSAINPFIYAFYSVDFRAAFWRLTFRRFFNTSAKAQFPSTLSIRR